MVRILINPIFFLLAYGVVLMPQVVSDTMRFGGGTTRVADAGRLDDRLRVEAPPALRPDTFKATGPVRTKVSRAAAWATGLSLAALIFLIGCRDREKSVKGGIHHA